MNHAYKVTDYSFAVRSEDYPEEDFHLDDLQMEMCRAMKEARERTIERILYGENPRVEKVVHGERLDERELDAPNLIPTPR